MAFKKRKKQQKNEKTRARAPTVALTHANSQIYDRLPVVVWQTLTDDWYWLVIVTRHFGQRCYLTARAYVKATGFVDLLFFSSSNKKKNIKDTVARADGGEVYKSDAMTRFGHSSGPRSFPTSLWSRKSSSSLAPIKRFQSLFFSLSLLLRLLSFSLFVGSFFFFQLKPVASLREEGRKRAEYVA